VFRENRICQPMRRALLLLSISKIMHSPVLCEATTVSTSEVLPFQILSVFWHLLYCT
jgi:hypothetical protein